MNKGRFLRLPLGTNGGFLAFHRKLFWGCSPVTQDCFAPLHPYLLLTGHTLSSAFTRTSASALSPLSLPPPVSTLQFYSPDIMFSSVNLFYQPLPIFEPFSRSLLPKCVLVNQAPEVLYNWPEGPHFQSVHFPGSLGPWAHTRNAMSPCWGTRHSLSSKHWILIFHMLLFILPDPRQRPFFCEAFHFFYLVSASSVFLQYCECRTAWGGLPRFPQPWMGLASPALPWGSHSI